MTIIKACRYITILGTLYFFSQLYMTIDTIIIRAGG